MSDDVERRLRAALSAKAEQTSADDLNRLKQDELLVALRRPSCTPTTPPRWRSWVPRIALGAASVGVVGLGISQLNLSPSASSSNAVASHAASLAGSAAAGSTPEEAAGAAAQTPPQVSGLGTGFAAPGAVVDGPTSASVDVGDGRLTLTPVISVRGGSVTVGVEVSGINHSAVQSPGFSVQAPSGTERIKETSGGCSAAATQHLDESRTFGTYDLPGGSGAIRIETTACSSLGTPIPLIWQGTVTALPK